MTRVNMDFVHDVNYKGFYHLQDSIVQGKPAGLKELDSKSSTIYEALATLPEKVKESWFGFDHFYSDYSFKQVLPIIFKEPVKKIMDVGANTGRWALECTAYSPDVHVTMCDLQGQLNVALKNAKEHGVSERVTAYAINMLDENSKLPKGQDVIWMSQFLDCFWNSCVAWRACDKPVVVAKERVVLADRDEVPSGIGPSEAYSSRGDVGSIFGKLDHLSRRDSRNQLLRELQLD